MINSRLKLHKELEDLLGSKHVYFQPPSNINIKYPCIIYSYSSVDNVNADDSIYVQKYTYQAIIVDSDPDSEIMEKLAQKRYARFTRSYVSDNLNHFVFAIKYYNEKGE